MPAHHVGRYSGPPGSTWNNLTRISEFLKLFQQRILNQADMSSERVLIEDNHPYLNHNGGTLAFGSRMDSFIYPSGDGGNADDVGNGHVFLTVVCGECRW